MPNSVGQPKYFEHQETNISCQKHMVNNALQKEFIKCVDDLEKIKTEFGYVGPWLETQGYTLTNVTNGIQAVVSSEDAAEYKTVPAFLIGQVQRIATGKTDKSGKPIFYSTRHAISIIPSGGKYWLMDSEEDAPIQIGSLNKTIKFMKKKIDSSEYSHVRALICNENEDCSQELMNETKNTGFFGLLCCKIR